MTRNVLILCTANSARSILGEALITARGAPNLRGYSAGSTPRGAPHPMALETLARHGLAASHASSKSLASKSWDVFAAPGAPIMHAVITVCDRAAGEVCPVWPGHPVQAHWGLPDPPAEAPRDELAAAFEAAFQALDRRARALAQLDWDALEGDPAALRAALQAIHVQADGDAA